MPWNPEWNNNKMQLYSQNGYNLTIRANGEVLGTQDDTDMDSYLLLLSAGISLVRILGQQSQLYLCFNCNGQLYGEASIQF